MLTKLKRHLIYIFTVLLTFCTTCSPALAAELDKIHPSISPTISQLSLDPGKDYTDSFRIGNEGSEPFSYRVSISPFQETDEHGSINYSEQNTYTQLTDWITLDTEKGTIAPGEVNTITYHIDVPADAPGSGQYAAIIIETDNNEADSSLQVNTITRIAHLLYTRVSGENHECAKIHNNQISTLAFEPPVTATSLVENCGNVDLTATYVLNVYPLFGNKKTYTSAEAPVERHILPGVSRYNTVSWTAEEGAPSLGIYSVEQVITIGDETSTTRQLVFIVPAWVLAIAGLFLVSLVILIITKIRSRHKLSD